MKLVKRGISALSIQAGTLWILIFLTLPGACKTGKPQISHPDSQAVILFVVGDVFVDGKRAEVGTVLHKGSVLEVKRRSLCDLQMRSINSEVMMRVTDNSKFRFDADKIANRANLNLRIDKGKIFTKVARLASDEQVRVISPAAVASVRGTEFETTVQEDGTTQVAVNEGQVGVRPRVDEIEDFPPEVISNSDVLFDTVEKLDESETVVEAGDNVNVPADAGDKMLEDSPDLKEALDSAEVKKARFDSNMTDQEKMEIGKRIDSSVENPDEAVNSLTTSEHGKLSSEKNLESEKKTNDREFHELMPMDQSVLKDDARVESAVKERNIQNQDTLQRRVETVLQKSSETVHLKNGKKLYGVIEQVVSTYQVNTVNGRIIINLSDVDHFSF